MNNIAIDIRMNDLSKNALNLSKHLQKTWSDGQLWYEMGLDIGDNTLMQDYDVTNEEYFQAVIAAFNENAIDALNAQSRRVA